jgi:glucose-6-phosphate 1-dehydrogenase
LKLFIFGSTGDLIKRKIFPALQEINKKDLEIYAIGRREFDNNSYISFSCQKCSNKFKEKINYLKINFESKDLLKNYKYILNKNKTNYFYLALPPRLHQQIIIYLGELKNKGFKLKILIEKPFGENLENGKELDNLLEKYNLKQDLFLADHYLFKQNILKLKKRDFNKIEIVSKEKIGIEGRNVFYDKIGAIKDMVQSHLLNILFRILKDKKELENLKVIKFICGQYGNGTSEGYKKEIKKESNTETFVYLEIKIKNKKIKLITGKELDKKESFVKIDNKKILMGSENSYIKLFEEFFKNKKENFPTIEQSILSWEIIKNLEKRKSKLIYYPKGSRIKEIIN